MWLITTKETLMKDNLKTAREVLNIQHDTNCVNYAIGGIRTIGTLIAMSNNEHPVIRLAGATLAISSNMAVRRTALLVSTSGWLLAKDKKKAFMQRGFSLGSVIIGVGVISQATKPTL